MNLSRLQKYVLRRGLDSRSFSISKKDLLDYYSKQKSKPKPDDQLGIITKSVERLIARGLVRGHGVKTAQKWFISKVALTREGIKLAKMVVSSQQKLPLKIKNKKYGRQSKR
jgi:hypothetical protein